MIGNFSLLRTMVQNNPRKLGADPTAEPAELAENVNRPILLTEDFCSHKDLKVMPGGK